MKSVLINVYKQEPYNNMLKNFENVRKKLNAHHWEKVVKLCEIISIK